MHSLSAKNTLIRESRNIGGETYWSLSVRLITAAANLGLWGYEHAASTDIRQADLSLSPLISCLACNHCVSAQAAAWLLQCRINNLACRQPKSVDPLILNDSSCITETKLSLLLRQGCLKAESWEWAWISGGIFQTVIHIVWVKANQCKMRMLFVRCVMIAWC